MNTDKKESSITEVKTLYARAAILLLAINFGFTGYITYNMSKIQQGFFDSVTPPTGAPSDVTRTAAGTTGATASQATPTELGKDSTAPSVEPVSDRDGGEEVIDK